MGYFKYVWLFSSLFLNDGFLTSNYFPTWTTAALATSFLPVFSTYAVAYVADAAAAVDAAMEAGSDTCTMHMHMQVWPRA